MKGSSISHKLFVDKILSTLLLLILGFGGIMAFNSMVRENNPDLAIPQALVIVEWPGAAAEQIEKEITKPLEDILNGLPGLKKLDSGSQFSYANVAVEFDASIEVDKAMQDLRTKVDEAKAEFPSEAKNPKIEQVSVNDAPVIEYVLFGPLDDYALNQAAKKIAKKLENHPLVKKVDKGGYRDTSVQIRLLPERLRSLGISPMVVQQRLQQANRDMSWGEFDSGRSVIQLYMSGRFETIEQLKKLPIHRMGDNRVVHLEEVAEVYKGLDRATTETWFSLKGADYASGISLGIKKRPGADTLALISDVKTLMIEYSHEPFWPDGLQTAIVSDQSEEIQQSFNDIFDNIWQAMLAVFIILMVLLTWREAIIAGLAIPLTFLATLTVLWLTGSTLNSMVIIGMVLALGLLVDVFILVMEGMHENLYSKKLTFSEAALATVKTYAMPAFSGQLTTILAMMPMLAIGGIDGKFIRLLPLTGVLCLVFSYIIAFLVAIPLSQVLLKNGGHQGISRMDRFAQKAGNGLKNLLLKHIITSKVRAASWVFTAFLLWLGAMYLASTLPSLLYPKSDGRNLAITIQLSPDATLEQSRKVAQKAGDYLKQFEFFESVTLYVGQKSPRAVGSLKEQLSLNTSYHLVGFSVLFTPKDEREKLAFEYLDQIRTGLEQHLADVPGISVTFKPETGGSSTEDPLQIVLKGSDTEQLRQLAIQVKQQLSQVEGVTDIRDNLGYFKTQLRIKANSELLNFHGITEDQFATQLRLATESDEYGKFKMPGIEEDLEIRLSTAWHSRGEALGGPQSAAELELISIFTPDGKVVPLNQLIDYEIRSVPPVYIHNKTERSITVMAKVQDITVQQVIDQIEPAMQQAQQHWPPGYNYYYGGEAESSAETYGSAGIAFGFAIFMVFAVLTLTLGSFAQAFVVVLTIPLALIGTFSGFWLLNLPFSFPAMIGLITLVGIVVNNAIVMVDTMNSYRTEGADIMQAAASGAADRLRPIVGTTITTLVGLVPLALSDPMWYPLCMAIIFGLLASTIVATFVIPAMYLLVSREAESSQ